MAAAVAAAAAAARRRQTAAPSRYLGLYHGGTHDVDKYPHGPKHVVWLKTDYIAFLLARDAVSRDGCTMHIQSV